jgi:NAD-dependent deacetylase
MNAKDLKTIVNQSSNIVFFGGAGTSTESCIPDFRSETGLYQAGNDRSAGAYPPEVILSRSFFHRHPELFYEFYRSKMIYKDAKPNAAHLTLADLESSGRLKAVITQNIDGLHQLAGSRKVLELHGSVHRNFCMGCGKFIPLEFLLKTDDLVPKCEDCGGIIKPDVVLYEEMLDREVLETAVTYISEAEVLIVGGTSLTVHPAAGLIDCYRGDKLIFINQTETPYDTRANYIIRDSIGKVMSSLDASHS